MSDIGGPVDDGGIQGKDDPFALFDVWMAEAKKAEPNNHDAMSVASVDGQGRPNVRMVLLKEAKAGSFVFYTNYESAKGIELIGQPHAALCFHWKSLGKQVRIRGSVARTTAAESDAYFAISFSNAQRPSTARDCALAQQPIWLSLGRVAK